MKAGFLKTSFAALVMVGVSGSALADLGRASTRLAETDQYIRRNKFALSGLNCFFSPEGPFCADPNAVNNELIAIEISNFIKSLSLPAPNLSVPKKPLRPRKINNPFLNK